MSDLDDAMRQLHERRSITLRRHELHTLANLADAEAERYIKRANRKNSAAYTVSANIKTAGSYRRIAQEIRTQTKEQ